MVDRGMASSHPTPYTLHPKPKLRTIVDGLNPCPPPPAPPPPPPQPPQPPHPFTPQPESTHQRLSATEAPPAAASPVTAQFHESVPSGARGIEQGQEDDEEEEEKEERMMLMRRSCGGVGVYQEERQVIKEIRVQSPVTHRCLLADP